MSINKVKHLYNRVTIMTPIRLSQSSEKRLRVPFSCYIFRHENIYSNDGKAKFSNLILPTAVLTYSPFLNICTSAYTVLKMSLYLWCLPNLRVTLLRAEVSFVFFMPQRLHAYMIFYHKIM